MKYICLGYIEPGKIEGMIGDERHAMLDNVLSATTICVPTDMLFPKDLFNLRRPQCGNHGTARRHSHP
jgi:hypothetical protein